MVIRNNKIQLQRSELGNAMILAKRMISKIYVLLLYYDSRAYDLLKPLWERDLKATFSSANWTKIYDRVFPKCTYISVHEQNYYST